MIQQAQSGTGKTATFCAGILQNLDYNLTECQALVLAPTRELAQQIEKVMRALGDYLQVRSLPASSRQRALHGTRSLWYCFRPLTVISQRRDCEQAFNVLDEHCDAVIQSHRPSFMDSYRHPELIV